MITPTDDLAFLNDVFSRVVVINLKRCEDRLHNMTQLLTSKGVKFEVFSAFDGATISEGDVRWDRDASLVDRFMPSKRRLRQGEVGCSISHNTIYSQILQAQTASSLILEDDIVLCNEPHLPSMRKLLQCLPKEWDLVYLGAKHNNFPEPLSFRAKRWIYYPLKRRWFRSERTARYTADELKRLYPRRHRTGLFEAGAHHGAYSYAVSLKAAGKLLNGNSPVRVAPDLSLMELIVSGVLRAYILPFPVFTQASNRYSLLGNPVD
jgi:GR25 family glycosyltransferase involved in LPS biosynthesis